MLYDISGVLAFNAEVQKRVRKRLYDFSDELKDKDLLKDKDYGKKQTSTLRSGISGTS